MIKTFEIAPRDVQKDIDYIYNVVLYKNGRRSSNYIKEKMLEPVVMCDDLLERTGTVLIGLN